MFIQLTLPGDWKTITHVQITPQLQPDIDRLIWNHVLIFDSETLIIWRDKNYENAQAVFQLKKEIINK